MSQMIFSFGPTCSRESCVEALPLGRRTYCSDTCRQAAKYARRVRMNRAAIEARRRQGCFDCGLNDPAVIELHHIGSKAFDLSSRIDRSPSVFKRELDKCIPLCANCHTRRHRHAA